MPELLPVCALALRDRDGQGDGHRRLRHVWIVYRVRGCDRAPGQAEAEAFTVRGLAEWTPGRWLAVRGRSLAGNRKAELGGRGVGREVSGGYDDFIEPTRIGVNPRTGYLNSRARTSKRQRSRASSCAVKRT